MLLAFKILLVLWASHVLGSCPSFGHTPSYIIIYIFLTLIFFLYLYLQFSNKVGTGSNLISQFQEEHSQVLQLLQSFSFCPENLPPASAATKKPFEKKNLEKQTSKKQVQGPVSRIVMTFHFLFKQNNKGVLPMI